jgi:hypothetical protein
MPDVSVIIPTYNTARYLSEALESVMDQTYKDIEVIVIDDGSTDDTREIVQLYRMRDRRIRYCLQDNSGPSAARNRGMREANGTYIAFLDADDLWMPRKIEKQIAILARNAHIGFVYCDNHFVDRDRREITDYVRKIKLVGGHMAYDLYNDFFLITSAVVMRASCCDTIGYFREDMLVGEDYEYFLKLAYRYPGDVVREKLMVRRVRGESLSRQDAVMDARNDIRTLTEFIRDNPDFRARYRGGVARRLAACYFSLGYNYWNRGQNLRSLCQQVRSLRFRFNAKALKCLLLSFVPARLVGIARKRLRAGEKSDEGKT